MELELPNDALLEQNLATDINNMRISLESSAVRTAITLEKFIQTNINNGVSPENLEEFLLKDLDEGGQIFNEFRKSIASTSNGAINNFRDSGQWAEDEEVNIKAWRWVAVLANTCPQCVERHGDVKTMEEWEIEGLPRAGFTYCKENCQCILVDADTTVLKPIERGSMRVKTAEDRVQYKKAESK
jgi:hypothetical protein